MLFAKLVLGTFMFILCPYQINPVKAVESTEDDVVVVSPYSAFGFPAGIAQAAQPRLVAK